MARPVDETRLGAVHAVIRRFSNDEYHRMGELGFFAEQRVELIHGTIVEMSAQGVPHVVVVRRLTKLFAKAVDDAHDVQVQGPLVFHGSEPEPDLAVVAATADHARTADLAVEVADSSLKYDLQTKAPLYASAGIPEYWIVDLVHWQILVHTDPAEDGYKVTRRYSRGEVVRSARAPAEVDVDALFADLP